MATLKPNMKGSGTVFRNECLERLTRTHIAIPLTLFTVISMLLMVYGFTQGFIRAWQASLLFTGGLLSFTLVEYVMHRYLFHLTPKTAKQEEIAYKMHGVHHDYPKDKDRLAMPIPLSLTLSSLFYLLFNLLMGNLVYGFLPGFLMGYAAYLGVHYMVHAFQPPKNFLKVLWIHHGMHHYKDPNNGFGVSSPFWDAVFGTMPRKN